MEEEGGVLITVVVVAVVLMAELLEVCVLLGIAKKEKPQNASQAAPRACIQTSLFEVYTYLPYSGKIKTKKKGSRI